MHRTDVGPAPRILILMTMIASLAWAPAGAAPGREGWDISLAPPDQGHGWLVIEGRVLDANGKPKRDARLLVHHAAPGGTVCYPDDPNMILKGRLRTNVVGEYRVRTRIPGPAEDVRHIHFELETPGKPVRAIALRLVRRQPAGSDGWFAELPQVTRLPDPRVWSEVTRDSLGDYHARWDLALENTIELPDSISARMR